jgi:hypothetical protein
MESHAFGKTFERASASAFDPPSEREAKKRSDPGFAVRLTLALSRAPRRHDCTRRWARRLQRAVIRPREGAPARQSARTGDPLRITREAARR